MRTGSSAPLVEVFASIQGEGRFVGMPMIFLRTALCSIRCLYCDTKESYTVKATCRVQARPPRTEPNPVTAARAVELLAEVGGAHGAPTVSITGGEPLLHAEFLLDLGARLREKGLRVHLETAALDPLALARVLPVLDHVSADFKLPGTLSAGDHRGAHMACIERVAAAGISIDVKMVLTKAVDHADFVDALERLAALRGQVMLVLQPVTPTSSGVERMAPERLLALAELAAARRFALRVLPQVHAQMNLP